MPLYGGQGSTIYRTAAQNLVAFMAAYDVDGYHADIASSADVSHQATVIGIVQSGNRAGGVVAISRQGIYRDPTNSLPIGRLFLGLNGAITNVAPTSGILVQIGFAAGPNEAVIDVQPAIVLL